MPYPHRYTTPEKVLATEYTLREVLGASVKHDCASYFLYEVKKGRRSIEVNRRSKAKRKMPLYMGVVLTRLVYFTLDNIEELPPPIEVPENIRTLQRPSRQTKDQEQELQKKAQQKRKQREEEGTKRNPKTRSNEKSSSSA